MMTNATAHILLTNQRTNRPVVDPKHMTADTLCGRAATANDIEFAAAMRPLDKGTVCADCASVYQHPDFTRMRARS